MSSKRGGDSPFKGHQIRQGAETSDEIRELLKQCYDDCNFKIHWRLGEFARTDLHEGDNLADVFTVTGDGQTAYGTTCREYVAWQWGDSGVRLLEDVVQFFGPYSDPDRKYHIFKNSALGMHLNLLISNNLCDVTIDHLSSGFDDAVRAIQLLTWLGSVFQYPAWGPPRCSRFSFHATFEQTFMIIFPITDLTTTTATSCWHELIPNTVIATGFPVRLPDVPGLDLDLEVMFDLADILFQTDLSDIQPLDRPAQGIFYTGAGSLLYPTARDTVKNVIKWHFARSLDAIVPPVDALLPLSVDDNLDEFNHVIGYAPVCEVNLGVPARRDYSQMRPSAEPLEKGRPSLNAETITAQFGKPPVAIGAAGRITYSKRLRAVVDPEKRRYDQILQTAERSATILYDCGQERVGWLVSQLSVILDLLHYYRWQKGEVDERGLVMDCAFWDGGASARAVLKRAHSLRVKYLYENDTWQTVLDFVKDVYCEMSKRKILQELPARGLLSLHHERLHGWDLLELLSPPDDSYRHETMVHETTSRAVSQYPSWLRLTQHIPVYFCQNLGEVITSQPRLPLEEIESPEKCLIASVSAMMPLFGDREICGGFHLKCGLVWESPDLAFNHGESMESSSRHAFESYVTELKSVEEHECWGKDDGTGFRGNCGLVIFGPERPSLVGRLNNWVDRWRYWLTG